MNNEIRMQKAKISRHIIIGDVHGELKGLLELLCHSGLVDKHGNWIGTDSVLVQTGDVIDRGPYSRESVEFLRRLQAQAPENGGRVVRLCGNHELMLLQGNYYFANFLEPAALARELREEILNGKILASYSDGIRLYTHAGLRSKVRKAVEQGMAAPERIAREYLSDELNRIFVNALWVDDLSSHPIFHVDMARGGRHDIGGIFWGDYSLIASSVNAYDIPQVFGHTPTRKNGVQHSHNFKLVDIDAGMFEGFGGHRVYLEVDQTGGVQERYKDGRLWRTRVLGDAVRDICVL